MCLRRAGWNKGREQSAADSGKRLSNVWTYRIRAPTNSVRVTISFPLCYDAYRLRSKIFAVNFPMAAVSADSHGVPVRPANMVGCCLLILLLGMREHGAR